eukprot:PhM_4_TR13907/c0_g1_i1/m.88823
MDEVLYIAPKPPSMKRNDSTSLSLPRIPSSRRASIVATHPLPTAANNRSYMERGPTGQLRDLIASHGVLRVLRECMVVLMQNRNIYGPLLKVVMGEYDCLVEKFADGGPLAVPKVTLFEDIAAMNSRYLEERQVHRALDRATQELEEEQH